jgi:hypothetical protein
MSLPGRYDALPHGFSLSFLERPHGDLACLPREAEPLHDSRRAFVGPACQGRRQLRARRGLPSIHGLTVQSGFDGSPRAHDFIGWYEAGLRITQPSGRPGARNESAVATAAGRDAITSSAPRPMAAPRAAPLTKQGMQKSSILTSSQNSCIDSSSPSNMGGNLRRFTRDADSGGEEQTRPIRRRELRGHQCPPHPGQARVAIEVVAQQHGCIDEAVHHAIRPSHAPALPSLGAISRRGFSPPYATLDRDFPPHTPTSTWRSRRTWCS